MTDVVDLLHRSEEMSAELATFQALSLFDKSERIISSRTLCGVSFEHAESVRVLVRTGNFTTSLGVLRMQYEALVKSVWALYAASENMLSKLQSDLNVETATSADNVPPMSKLLEELEGKAPPQAISPLLEFKEYSWKPLNSYIHGGTHAITRHGKGYPTELLSQAIRSSNGLQVMAGMMLVILSGDDSQQGKISDIQRRFSDCCPKLAPAYRPSDENRR